MVRLPSLVTFLAVAVDMLLYLFGVAFCGLVAVQVKHHVDTGGQLFFQPPVGCQRLSDGRLECFAGNAATMATLNNASVVTEEPKGRKAESHDEPTRVREADDADTSSEPEQAMHHEPKAGRPSSNQDDGPAGVPHDGPTTADSADPSSSTSTSSMITAHDIYDATYQNNAQLLEQYLQQRPQLVDAADHNHWNALHMAARAGLTDIVIVLLRHGADPKLRTLTGKTALDIAKERLGPEHFIVELLNGPIIVLDDGRIVTAEQFRQAANWGRVDQVQHYLEALANDTNILDDGDVNRWNALHMAARSGHAHVVKLLVDAGANPTLRTNSQKTALAIAQEKHGSDSEIVDILRSALADEL